VYGILADLQTLIWENFNYTPDFYDSKKVYIAKRMHPNDQRFMCSSMSHWLGNPKAQMPYMVQNNACCAFL
jgi:hypothetical protein